MEGYIDIPKNYFDDKKPTRLPAEDVKIGGVTRNRTTKQTHDVGVSGDPSRVGHAGVHVLVGRVEIRRSGLLRETEAIGGGDHREESVASGGMDETLTREIMHEERPDEFLLFFAKWKHDIFGESQSNIYIYIY